MRDVRQSGLTYDAASVAVNPGFKGVFLPSNYAVKAGSASRNSGSDALAAGPACITVNAILLKKADPVVPANTADRRSRGRGPNRPEILSRKLVSLKSAKL
jgi:hypothetical protein